ncbi:MAG: apolipoprotein N-acyltransferase [Alphaproteobacteria bacterium]|nr:apolipoprotein N-acyltransferase [Alphaproteobacteria bacterium]
MAKKATITEEKTKKTTTAKKTATKKASAKKATAAKTTVKKSAVKKMAVKKTATKKAAAKKPVAKKAVKVETQSTTTPKEVKSSWLEPEFWREKLEKTAAHPKTTALLLGVLLTAALPPFYYTLALFAAFAMVMFLACKTEKMRTLAAIGYWFGFGYFAAGFYWIGNALLVDAAKTGWLYPLVLFLNGAFFGLFGILPLMATKFGKNVLTKSMLFAAIWCLVVEWLRSFILTGFPWNPISSVLTFNPELMQILAYVGAHGASLILVLLAVLPAAWLIKPNRIRFYGVGFLLLACWAALWIGGGYVIENRPEIPSGDSLVVRLVQPSIPQTLKWNKDTLDKNLQEYIELSNAKDNAFVDFTIWGETAYPFDLMFDVRHNRRITPIIPSGGYLITGFLRRVDDGYHYTPYNSFGVVNQKGQLVGWYDKNHLVPFGEYIPFREYLPAWVKPVANVVAQFGRGDKFKTLQIGDMPAFAPLICYEIIFSDEVVIKGADRPTWAIVLTNDGWYGNSAGPYQHLAAAQMRAVEEGITVVRSANTGISAVINPYGEIKAQIPLGTRAAIDALVKPKEAHLTLFGQYGNKIPLAMCGGLILLAFLFGLFSRRKKS